MKTLAILLILLVTCLRPVTAAPATPVWTTATPVWATAAGVRGLNHADFSSDPYAANWLSQTSQMNYMTASAAVGGGSRLRVGYGFRRGGVDGLGEENNMVMAAFDKKLNDNWWVTLGYQNGMNSVGSLYTGAVNAGAINLGATYRIAPNAAVAVGYSYLNNYEIKNTITTEVFIRF